MKIGVMVESFNKGFEEGLRLAAQIGASGVQAYATGGFLSPEVTKGAKLAEVKSVMAGLGLEFSALCGDFGYPGFEDPAQNPGRIEKSKRILDLSAELGCGIVTTHVGAIPAEENRKKEIMRAACRQLAEYADAVGAVFALETGQESATVLYDFLESLGANGVRVNFDPANLVMCMGEDPGESVSVLKKYIVHTHAKDGIMLGKGSYKELPLGQGGVNFDKYLTALAGTGYDGYLTVERECGDDPTADIRMAVDFLGRKLVKLSKSK